MINEKRGDWVEINAKVIGTEAVRIKVTGIENCSGDIEVSAQQLFEAGAICSAIICEVAAKMLPDEDMYNRRDLSNHILEEIRFLLDTFYYGNGISVKDLD